MQKAAAKTAAKSVSTAKQAVITDPKEIVRQQIAAMPIEQKRQIFPPMTKKNFVVRKSWYGREQLISFKTKSGKTVMYNHDRVYEAMIAGLELKPAWNKYGYWSQSTELPTIIRYRTDLITDAEVKLFKAEIK
jgi:hypothetical protein